MFLQTITLPSETEDFLCLIRSRYSFIRLAVSGSGDAFLF
nr:MAG TPA: hypothetical protein [Caudoviricetes sp.]